MERLNKVRARVVGPAGNNALRVELLPERPKDGVLILDVHINAVPMADVPADLRIPNSEFWLLHEDGHTYRGIARL